METWVTPHAPAARPMGKHGHLGAWSQAGHTCDIACSMRRTALKQAQKMLGKKDHAQLTGKTHLHHSQGRLQ